MSTYLFQGCYTSVSVAAMVQKPEDRSMVVRGLVEGLGGKLEGFWLAFGEHDFVGIAQLPTPKRRGIRLGGGGGWRRP